MRPVKAFSEHLSLRESGQPETRTSFVRTQDYIVIHKDATVIDTRQRT